MTGPGDSATGSLPSRGLALIGETVAMVRFYSRLPVPSLGIFDDPARPPAFAIACRMLPIASLVIALPGVSIALLLSFTHLPALAAAGIVLAVATATTGALHEDGLADVADGFGGGATIERKLDIMKDSRVGAYGVVALGLALIVRAGLLAALFSLGPSRLVAALLAASVISRIASLALFAALPPARPTGLASSVGRPGWRALATALTLAGAIGLLLLLPGFGASATVTSVGLTLVMTIGFGRLASAQIGGQTGDVIGAAQVLAEIAFVAGLLVL
jgi:adenosylcobinamide-GDP ribazoletransferase